MYKKIICILLLLLLPFCAISDNEGESKVYPFDNKPILQAIDQNRDDSTISHMIDIAIHKTTFGGNENENNKEGIMEIYDKLVSKYGVTSKYKKSFESILFFMTECSDKYEPLKKVYDDTSSLMLWEDYPIGEQKIKSYICSFFLQYDNSDENSSKYEETFDRIMYGLSKSDNKEDQYYACYSQAVYYSLSDFDKAIKNIEMAETIAKESGDKELINDAKRLREDVEHNIKVLKEGVKNDTEPENSNNSRLISLFIMLVAAIFMIALIISKIRKYKDSPNE